MKITLNSHEYDIETNEKGRTVCDNFTGYTHDIIQELQLSFPRLFTTVNLCSPPGTHGSSCGTIRHRPIRWYFSKYLGISLSSP